jgi:hypothetical protein
MKIRILQNFNGLVDGKSIRFKEGQEVDLSDPVALDNFLRGGYAELVKPAVKIVEKPAIAKGIKVK